MRLKTIVPAPVQSPAPAPVPMKALRLGRFAGAPIEVRPDILATFPLMMFGILNHGGVGVAALMLPVLVLSILAHELAHAAVCRRFGARVLQIEINGLGGFCRFDTAGLGRRPFCAICVAGPLANFAIALALMAVAGLRAPLFLAPYSFFLDHLLTGAILMNVALGLFNLIPAFPLDGGLIAQTLLTGRLGEDRAALLVSGFALVAIVPFGLLLIVCVLMGAPAIAPLDPKRNWQIFARYWRERRATRHQCRTEDAVLAACDADLAAIVARAGAERRARRDEEREASLAARRGPDVP